LDGNLHDGALHWRTQLCAVGAGGTGGLAAWLALLLSCRLLGAVGGYRAQRRWKGDFQALAANLDGDAGALILGGVLAAHRHRVGLDESIEFGFDPAGVHLEWALSWNESRVAHHGAVERQHGGHALDLEFFQGAAS